MSPALFGYYQLSLLLIIFIIIANNNIVKINMEVGDIMPYKSSRYGSCISIHELCNILGVDQKQAIRLLESGKINAYKRTAGSGYWIIPEFSVDLYLSRQGGH